MEAELEPSIREHADKLGMPDLILFTGDLTNRGAEAEFRQVDRFLETLKGWLTDATGLDRQPLIPRFRLQQIPRTVEEYLAFVDNGGYADSRWWDAAVWDLFLKIRLGGLQTDGMANCVHRIVLWSRSPSSRPPPIALG